MDNRAQFARQELAKRELTRRGGAQPTTGRRIQDVPEGEFQQPNVALETAKGTLGTLGRSAGNLIKGTYEAARHPIKTASNLMDLGIGAIEQHTLPQEQNTPQKQMASQVGQFYKDRYGGVDQIANTVANDPFGFVADVGGAAGLAGGAARGVGRMTGHSGLVKAASFPMTSQAVKTGASVVGKTAGQIGTAAIKAPINAAKFGAERTINSMIKPLLKNFSYGKNPGAVAYEKIVANNWDDWIGKVDTRLNEVGRGIDTMAKKVTTPVNLGNDINRQFRVAITKAARNGNQAVVDKLTKTYQAITEDLQPARSGSKIGIQSAGAKKLDNISATEALKINRHIGEQASWTGNPTDDKLFNAAIQDVYRATRRKIEGAVPGIKQESERYANLLSAKVASVHREKILQRQNMVGLAPKLLGGYETLEFLSSGDPSSLIKGIAIVGADKLISSPAFKTRLAAGLAKLSEIEKAKIFNLYPQLKAKFGKAGRAVAPAGNNNQPPPAGSPASPSAPQPKPQSPSGGNLKAPETIESLTKRLDEAHASGDKVQVAAIDKEIGDFIQGQRGTKEFYDRNPHEVKKPQTKKSEEFAQVATPAQIRAMKIKDIKLKRRSAEIKAKGVNTTDAEDVELLRLGEEQQHIRETIEFYKKKELDVYKKGEYKKKIEQYAKILNHAQKTGNTKQAEQINKMINQYISGLRKKST